MADPNNGWLECPECHTGYRADRIGVSFGATRQVTIVCSVCKTAFNINIVVTTTWEQQSRWNPLKEEITRVTAEVLKRVS